MNNKGFAITGIIYTLFILFLMILISILSGIRIFQRTSSRDVTKISDKFEELEMIDATTGLTEFYGEQRTGQEIIDMINQRIIEHNELQSDKGLTKYIFYLENAKEDFPDLECVAYAEGSDLIWINDLVLSPKDCNDYFKEDYDNGVPTTLRLKRLYKLKGW